jgi:geranylgeranyl reductase family protein
MIAVSSLTEPVIVVGAGPAGATAARALAAAGVAVRLLDRAVFPRNKPCGGGISVRVLTRFPYLAHELARIATHAVSRLYLEGPDGDSTVVNSDAPAALMIRRVEFDALLVSLAQQAGAELVTGADIVQAREDDGGVTLRARDGREFRAPVVIAADGVHSVVARRLGINPGWSSAAVALDMMEETPRSALRDVDPSALWVSYGFDPDGRRPGERRSAAAEGYAYIFPKRDHVNIGIGYVLSHYRAAVGRAPYDLQRSFVAALRDRGIVVGDSVRKNFTPFLIPVGGPLRDPGRGRTLVAGDAGGFVNGFTAEGIYYAMVSGELAAKVVAAGGDVAHLAARYRRACNHEVGAELRDSVLIQRYLFGDRRRIAAIINGAQRAAPTTQAILDFAIGRRSYRSLRRSLLLRSPVLAGRLLWEQLRKNFVPRRATRSRI